MARLMKEHDNIRAGLRSSLAAGDGEKLARFTLALGWFWFLRCFFREGRSWFDAALNSFTSASAATRAQLLIGAGELAWAQGDHGPDRAIFEEALALAVETGDDSLIGDALLRTALADHGAGEIELAQQHLEESIGKLREHGSPLLLGEALNNLGWVRGVILGDAVAARQLLDESLSIARQCGDLWLLNSVLDSVGNLEITQGNLDTAQAFQEEGLRICTALDAAWSLPHNLEGFVRLSCARHQFERGLCIAGAAARLREDVGSIQVPGDKAQIEMLIREARAHLPDRVGDAAWRNGWQMAEADAVEYSLSGELTLPNSG